MFTKFLAINLPGLTQQRVAVMDIWNQLMQGFATAGTPVNLLWAFVGCALGTAVGVLPGIGPAVAVAMLLPITAKVDATASMIFFAGIYYGAMYGGSTTSILLNTPGETASMVTAMEGNKMAKSGRAGAALATAAIGSFVAGTIATVLVTLFAPVVAEFAVKLGPPEYFMLMLLAFTTVSAVLGQSTLRGLTALFVGLARGPGGPGPDHRPGALHRWACPNCWTASRSCWWRWACSPWPKPCMRCCSKAGWSNPQNKMSRVHMTRDDWRRSIPGLAARHRHRRAVWLHSGRRHRDPDLPELRRREEAGQGRATRPSSAPRARSKAWPAPRPPTTPP